jgi:hypothetical protein
VARWQQSVPPFYRLVLTLAFAGIVIALSVAPGLEQPDDTLFTWVVVNTAKPIQKAMHVGVYATLAILWMWTLQSVESRFVRIVLSLAVTFGLGVVLEWYQTRVPGRYGTLFDVLLNLAGILIGLVAAAILL